MKHSVPHDLDMSLAKKVTEKALDGYANRFTDYNPKVNWVSDDEAHIQFSAKGITLKGVFNLRADRVDMDMDVPFLLKAFQKKAIKVIDEEIQEWIGKAKAGDLD